MASELLSLGVPVLFTLAIVYGALETADMFKSRRVNSLIAAVIALFVAGYAPAQSFINGVLPYAIGLFVVVFFLAFVKKLFVPDSKGKTDFTGLYVVLGLILIFLGYQQAGGGLGLSDETITVLAVAVVLLLLLGAYKQKKEGKE